MEKRVTIIQAIKAGNFKDLNESDVLYYFDETCSTLFQTYSQKYITSRVKYQIYHDFFSDLRKQYYEQTDSKNLNQTMEDIENFERLAQGLSFLESQDLDEYTHLAKKYPLYKPDIDDNGIPISRFFSYDELSDAYELALKEKNIAYQKLTDKMEDLIFSSITLKI